MKQFHFPITRALGLVPSPLRHLTSGLSLGLALGLALSASLMLFTSTASASSDESLLPTQVASASLRARSWTHQGDFVVAPEQSAEDGFGTRVAALVQTGPEGKALALEAKGIRPGAQSDWLPMEETFVGQGHRVLVVDLGARYRSAQIRVARADDARIDSVGWELLTPAFPDAGRISREASAQPGVSYALASPLTQIGVIDRGSWGARASGCSATEDDWYRMAVHHTAGLQTSGGSVQGALQATQAYTMDSGGYCDLPYQMMVGYDGTLWEGRSLDLFSGATGGGNNDGNLAVCFMGCYHPSGCPGGAGDAVTEEMMARGRLLIQTLVRLHDIASTADAIRGHRDWPGNATACPGDFTHARLDELRTDLSWYAAAELTRNFPSEGEPALLIPVDQPVELTIELQNLGGLAWQPGSTFLGTASPRDGESALYDVSWPSANRAATVDEIVEPGQTGRFRFFVHAASAGEYTQSFALVQEGTTWFADAPWGGGPADEAIVLRVQADDEAQPEPDPDPEPGEMGEGGQVSAGCNSSNSNASLGLALLALLLTLRLRSRGARAR